MPTPLPDFPRTTPPPLADLTAAELSLRAARQADLPFLYALYAGFRAAELALAPWTAAQKEVFLVDQFRLQHVHFTRFHPRAGFWVVERPHAHPVGRLYLDRSARFWRIVDIGLAPEARGQGLGSVLLTWVQHAAEAARAKGVDLHVAPTNPRAGALYARLGFRETQPDVTTHRRMEWRPGGTERFERD